MRHSDRSGTTVEVGDVLETLSGFRGTMVSIDRHGYARFAGRTSTAYVRNAVWTGSWCYGPPSPRDPLSGSFDRS